SEPIGTGSTSSSQGQGSGSTDQERPFITTGAVETKACAKNAVQECRGEADVDGAAAGSLRSQVAREPLATLSRTAGFQPHAAACTPSEPIGWRRDFVCA